MGTNSIIDAKSIEKQDPMEQEKRKVALLLHVFFECNINPSAQTVLHNQFGNQVINKGN